MFYYADMKNRQSFSEIVLGIKKILIKEKDLSIRQLANKTHSQWRTIEKALRLLKELNIVKERFNDKTKRVERLFNLK